MRRKGRKRNLVQTRSSSAASSTTRMATRKLLPLLALAWSLAATAPSLLPVAAALPDVKSTSPSTLSTNIERALDKKTKTKIKESLRKTKTKKKKIDDDDSNRSKKDNQAANMNTNNIENKVQIESILARRKFPVRMFLRIVCLLLAVRSFSQCTATSGIPYAQTVMQIVYGASEAANRVGSIPTAMEIKLANMILSASDDYSVMLPPRILPSAGPLMKFVASVVAYIGLTFLLPLWSTNFRVLLDYRKLEKNYFMNENMSVLVRLDPSSSGSSVRKTKRNNLDIIPLQKAPLKKKKTKKNAMKNNSKDENSIDERNYIHPTDFFFDVDHSRVYCDLDTKECIDGAPSLQRAPLTDLQKLIEAGGLSKKTRTLAKERYEVYNTFPLATPTFQEAFLERISSPLVVIQLIGRLVALLEEGMGAVISMVMTLGQHFFNAKQAIVSATQLAEEVKTNLQDTSGYQVSVWNESKQRWVSTAAGQLVPGDIFRLTMSQEEDKTTKKASKKVHKQQELIVPVDALVIKGQCLTNEAILTGESVPQVKTPLDFQDEIVDETNLEPTRHLDLHKDRSSVLFAGTTLFHTLGGGTPSNENNDNKESTGGSVTCIALRTGTYSSKGRLLKALKGSSHVGAISNDQSEKDGIRMVASLSACAALSCFSLFVNGNSKSARISPFRRVIQCTRIALASIPSDLPLAQASIARACSRMLRDQSDVVCSEPGSLLTAAYVDTVVFDKVRIWLKLIGCFMF